LTATTTVDIVERGHATADADEDGRTDNPVGDNGLDDVLESNGTVTALPDSDSNGMADYIDTDADGDSCSDANEAYYYSALLTNVDEGDNPYYGTGNPPDVDSEGRVSAAAYDTGAVTAVTDPTNATACSSDPDYDQDGVPDSVEKAGPNGGDANDDGVEDFRQSSVASLIDASGNNTYVVLEVNSSTCDVITDVQIIAEEDMVVADPDYDYPVGLLDYTLKCVNPGESASINVWWYGLDRVGYYRKYGSDTPGGGNAHYKRFGVQKATKVVEGSPVWVTRFVLTDGEPGDETDTAGEIVDPSGPGVANPEARDDLFTQVEDQTVSGNIVTEDNDKGVDNDPQGDSLSVKDFTVAGATYNPGETANLSEGDLTIASDGTLTFVPKSGFTGSVQDISYNVTDGTGEDNASIYIVILPDSDGDELADQDDLDDDNDGIVDDDEVQCTNKEKADFVPYDGELLSATRDGNLRIGASVITAFHTPFGDAEITTDEISDSHYSGEYGIRVGHPSGSATTEDDRIETTIIFSDVVRDLQFRISDIDYGDHVKVEVYDENGQLIPIDSSNYALYSPTIVHVDDNEFYADDYDGSSSDTREGTVDFTFPGTKISKIILKYFDTESGGTVTYAEFNGTVCDTDSDGKPDYLDTDSDDDGCYDAVEGAGHFNPSDLDSSGSLVGGVDGDGIPTVTDGGTSPSPTRTTAPPVMPLSVSRLSIKSLTKSSKS